MSQHPYQQQPIQPESGMEPKPPRPKWKRWHKITIGVVLALFLLILAGTCAGEDEATTAPPAAPPAAKTTTAPAPPPAKQAEQPPAPKPDPVQERKDNLRSALEDKLGDLNRKGAERVKLATTAKAGKPIKITIAINDNLTENLIGVGARNDAKDALEVVNAEADWKYSKAIIRETFVLTDDRGHEDETQVAYADYSRSTVKDINYENVLVRDKIWDIADDRVVRVELQPKS